MKKAAEMFLALAAALLLLASCAPARSNVSMYDLSRKMLEAGESLSSMKYVSSEDKEKETLFSSVSSMDYSKVDSFFISYAESGKGNADEIVVIAVKNTADVPEAEQSLRDHLAYRRSLYASYDRGQLSKLDSAEVAVYGDLVSLIVADDSRGIRRAFEEYMKEAH